MSKNRTHSLDLRPAPRLIDIDLGRLKGKATSCHGLLLTLESAPCVGKVGQDEHDQNADEHCDGALDDVQPLPSRKSSMTGQAGEDARCNQVAESTTQKGSGVEDGHAQRQLCFGVPFRQIEKHPGELLTSAGKWQDLGTSKRTNYRRVSYSKRCRSGRLTGASTKPNKNRHATIPP